MWGDSGNLLLRLSHNQEEVAAYNEAVEKGEDDLPRCYLLRASWTAANCLWNF